MPLQLSASLNLTGSINLSGSMSSTQTLNLTASYSVNSATSSYISSSNINGTVLSSSYSLSSSFAPVNTNITASWSNNSFTASYVVNAQSASYYGGNVISSSYSLSSSFAPTNTNITASWSTNSLTASSLVVTNNYTASRLNITSTGSFTIVGIGTTSPSSKLQIGSNSTYTGSDNSVNVRIGDSLLASRVYPLTLANTAGAFINNEVALSFIVGGTIQATGIISTILRNTGTLASDIVFTNYNSGLYERMRITGDGYVGIGTSSPTNVLTVYNSSTPTIDLNTGTSTSRGRISATSSDLSIDALTSSPLLFKVDSSEKMRVAANGNVGIGTSNPGYKLDVAGEIKQTGNNVWISGGRIGSDVSGSIDINYNNGISPTFTWYNGGTSALARITSTGALGLGTTSPSAKLEVSQTAASYPFAKFTDTVFGPGAYLSAFSNVGGNVFGFAGLECNLSNTTNRRLWIGVDSPYGTDEGFIGTPDNIPISFYTTSSVRMTITSTGNVGIGTSNPQFLLDVVNTSTTSKLRIGGASSNNGAQLILAGSNTTKNWVISNQQNINGALEFTQTTATGSSTVDTTPSMVINSTGNVGIGTSTVNNKLDIWGSTGTTFNMGNTDDSGRGGKLTFISSSAAGRQFYVGTNSSIYNLVFGIDSIEKMRLDINGNVGIGTSSPASKLDIRGGTQLLNTSGSTSSATSASLMLVGQNTKGGANYHDFLYTSNTVAGGVNPQKYFRQDNTGNIEIVNSAYNNTIFILTDSGSLQLPVAQSSNVTQLRNTGAGLKISGLSIFDDGNPHIHNTTPSTNMWINVSGSGNVIINGQTGASGGVCIGSTNSRGKLDVNGSVNYDQGTFYYYANIYGGTSSGTIPISVYATDRMAASEFDARSDRRLKKDIRVIDTQMALQFVKTSKPVLYKWNIGSDDGDKSGYIAQDIIKIGFPHLVSGIPNDDIKQETDSDGYISPDKVQLSMNYDQVVPLLDVALKNALQRIEQLEAKLAALENKIN
jgi:hypothetical protein